MKMEELKIKDTTRYEKSLAKVEDGMILIGSFVLYIMMALVIVDVGGRFLFNKPIAGNIELTEILMVFAIYFGMAYTQRENGHVGMDLFITKVLKGKAYYLNNIVIIFLSLFINIMIAYYSFGQALVTYHNKSTSIYLNIPMWFLPLFVSIGTIILCLRLSLEFKRSWSTNENVKSKKL